MFDRFIVATDLSLATFDLVNCLGGLKVYGAKHCLLLQCISFQEGASLAYGYGTAPVESRLNEQRALLEEQGFMVEARTVLGAAKREVPRIADEEDYALIVVGTQGQAAVVDRVLGGVAFGIISKSTKPVLVLPIAKMPGDSEVCEPVARCGFSDHLWFATDFSDTADHAFTYVERMVEHGVRAVTLIHVQDKEHLDGDREAMPEELNQIARERLTLLASRLKARGPVEVTMEIPYGFAKQAIIQGIDPDQVSMIVMGTQGRGFFGEFFLGSIAAHVARRSGVPTLLIPPVR